MFNTKTSSFHYNPNVKSKIDCFRCSHYLYSNAEFINYVNKSQLTPTDTQIFTDGSHEYESEEKFENYHKAGIGIFMSSFQNQYHFLQAIGSQSIFYAELYVIALIKKIY